MTKCLDQYANIYPQNVKPIAINLLILLLIALFIDFKLLEGRALV